jgi:hypothetical protein
MSAHSRSMLRLLFAGAATGFVLRIIPLLPSSGLSRSVSYDEGVYFSAAALVARGVVPYRDFVFIHPPGILIGLAPLVWLAHHFLAYDDIFLTLRAVAGLIGAVNVALVGRLSYRSAGPVAAVAAMLLYATFPPAVIDEGRLLLEPFMTFFCLLAASCWLAAPEDHSSRRGVTTGVWLGIACSIKLYGGGIVLVACLVAGGRQRSWKQRLAMCLSAGGVFGLLTLPFVARAGGSELTRQILVAQLLRPPDTAIPGGVLGRALHMFQYGPASLPRAPLLAGVAVGAIGVAVAAWAWFRGGVSGHFWAFTWTATVAFLLASPTYFSQYAAFLAPSTAVLAGMAISRLVPVPSQTSPALMAVVVAMLGSILVLNVFRLAETSFGRSEASDFGAIVRRNVPERECLFALPSTLGIAGNRLPPYDATRGPLVDPYGEFLLLSTHGSRRFDNAREALRSPPAQARLRAALEQCRFVALGTGPTSQPFFSMPTTAWFLARFDRLEEGTPELWMRTDRY